MKDKPASKGSPWKPHPKVANLVRYEPSGIYFARVRVGGKLIWKSLKTDVFTTAQLRLADFIKEQRTQLNSGTRTKSGKMTVADSVAIYRQRLNDNPRLKPNAKLYRDKCISGLLRSWPGLGEKDIRKISKDDCLSWAAKYASDYSPSVYNNTVGTLRQILAIGIEKGSRYGNPALEIVKRRPTQKKLALPSHDQFNAFVQSIEKAGAWCSRDCADLVRFLAFGGFRKGEAANVTWADCDFGKGLITVRGHQITGTNESQL